MIYTLFLFVSRENRDLRTIVDVDYSKNNTKDMTRKFTPDSEITRPQILTRIPSLIDK